MYLKHKRLRNIVFLKKLRCKKPENSFNNLCIITFKSIYQLTTVSETVL